LRGDDHSQKLGHEKRRRWTGLNFEHGVRGLKEENCRLVKKGYEDRVNGGRGELLCAWGWLIRKK